MGSTILGGLQKTLAGLQKIANDLKSEIKQYIVLVFAVPLAVRSVASRISEATPGKFLRLQFQMNDKERIEKNILNLISSLESQLADAGAKICSASSKLGAPASEVPPGASPIQRLLSLVTDVQYQLEATQEQIKALQNQGDSLSSAIQIELNEAQKELEYSSPLLSEAVDDMKMLMNIQGSSA